LRAAGLLGSIGKVASTCDNSVIESFIGSMQIELLDHRRWTTRGPGDGDLRMDRGVLQPHPQVLPIGYLSHIDYQTLHKAANTAA
jgi:putative transposase